MIELYITPICNISENRINEIDKNRADKAMRYKLKDDKLRAIAGGLFIKRFLGDVKITTGLHGKPETENGFHFNISHSGKYVLFAFSDAPVGCDIEILHNVDFDKISKYVFCTTELNALKKTSNKEETFFQLWTRKESFLKCIGEGFHRNGKTVDTVNHTFFENGVTYYFNTFMYDNHSISVCSSLPEVPSKPNLIIL